MAARPLTAPKERRDDSPSPKTRSPTQLTLSSNAQTASAQGTPLQPAPASGQPESLPLTPPQSPGPQADSTSSPRSHQEYLESLQPPSDQDFARLCKLQEEREREHRQRDNELRRENEATARKSMEARRDFMHTKALSDEQAQAQAQAAQGQRHSIFSHRQQSSVSQLRPGTRSKGEDGDTNDDTDHDSFRSKAALVIQRSYRGYRVRREMKGLGLDASTRWTHAIRDAQWKELTKPRARGSLVPDPRTDGTDGSSGNRASSSKSNARQNWMKAATIARRAGGDEDSDHSISTDSSSPDSEEWAQMSLAQREALKKKRQKAQEKRRKHAQVMGLQYFLEMVDLQHRYGSNLRTYHEEWKRSDTKENFFYWLDHGEGKNIDLTTCPRERLDRERVRYLNREERQHYLVKVDQEGRLVWAKNGLRIDTTEEWKDSMHGIVPADDPTPAFAPEVERHIQDQPHDSSHHHPQDRSSSSSPMSSSSRESELEAAMAAKYANPDLDNAKGTKKIRHVSAATIFNKLLRKSVRKNTWIFVADTSFRLYVGIKSSGAFQHSSFLHGSRISAAGLIKVKNGRLTSLSPLSGHYRPPASNFRAFVHSLEDEGVDMSHVSISRSYAVLVGLELYIKTQRKSKELLKKMRLKKTKVLQPEEAKRLEEESWDKSQSAAKERRVLEKEREENKATVKILQKLGVRPRTPAGQKNGDVGDVEVGRDTEERRDELRQDNNG